MTSEKLLIPYTGDGTTTPAYAWSQLIDGLEKGVLGVVNIPCAGQTFVTVGDADSRTGILSFSGGGAVTATIPGGSGHVRWHIVQNKNSGTLQVRISGQATPVAVEAGKCALIYNDGAVIFQVGGSSGGDFPYSVATKNIPANSNNWLNTGVTVAATEALAIATSGTVAFNSNPDAVFYTADDSAIGLFFAVVSDGSTPTGDAAGQFNFGNQNTIVGQTGVVWARIRDAGDPADNQGSFDLTLVKFKDLKAGFRLLAQKIRQSEVVGLQTSLAGKLNANQPIFIPNVATAPATPVGGVIFYSINGVAKVKNAAGTEFTIGG